MKIIYINILFYSVLLLLTNYNISNIDISDMNKIYNIYYDKSSKNSISNNSTNKSSKKSVGELKTNGLDIHYDKTKKIFVCTSNLNKYIYKSIIFLWKKNNERMFYYQKFKKTVLIPLYIFGFQPYHSLPIVDNDYREVRYDSNLQDDWKNYYNLQMHQYDVETYFDTHPEEYNCFGEVRYGQIFHHIKKNGDFLVERINNVNIFDKERYLVGQLPGKKEPDLVCKAVQIKYDVYKVYDSNYYTNNEFKDLKYLEINKKEKGFRIYLSPLYNSVGVNTYLCNIDKDGKVCVPGFEQKDKNGYCGIVFLFNQKYMSNLDKQTLSSKNMINIYDIYNKKFKTKEIKH